MSDLADRAEEIVRAFINCVIAEDEAERNRLADNFNALTDRFLDDHREESVGTIAYRISSLGVPYQQAFSDLVTVRLNWGTQNQQDNKTEE